MRRLGTGGGLVVVLSRFTRLRSVYSVIVIASLLINGSNGQQDLFVDMRTLGGWASQLGEDLANSFDRVTRIQEIAVSYDNLASADEFLPEQEINRMEEKIATLLKSKADLTWDLHASLTGKDLLNSTDGVNDVGSPQFVRYVDAKRGSNEALVEPDYPVEVGVWAAPTVVLNYTANANLFNLQTDLAHSAVHVPTPIYRRDPNVLLKIQWSDIDVHLKSNKQQNPDLTWQFFCSESGFMRYYPATRWSMDKPMKNLDLFDCRTTEWYVDGATGNKHILIMLDLSGSMHGERLQIAKQTIEAIMETLTENDFFNIIIFNRKPQYLDDCFRGKLIQATLKNRKVLRAKLNGIESEGKADYPKALAEAFHILLKLPPLANWTSPAAYREMKMSGTIPDHVTTLKTKEGWRLFFNKQYLQAIDNATELLHCNSAIMLITDGAPEYYEDSFKKFNSAKRVRFFSYLIGDETTDFNEVTWMACNNRGYMVHIANLADVQEKVQQYIKVMSRPIAHYPEIYISKDRPGWTGVYFERLFRYHTKRPIGNGPEGEKLVTTVSYPVVVNHTFMGVVGITVPISTIEELTLSFRLGTNAYAFLVDHNGYAMFHPQLRIMMHGIPKPNYNSIDVLELETLADNDVLRAQIIHGKSSSDAEEVAVRDILWTNDDLSRVYKQTNQYFYRPVKGTMFTLVLAIPETSRFRITAKADPPAYGEVKVEWYQDQKWKIHPQWHYCLVNDSDAGLSPEAAWLHYVRQMAASGRLPELCTARTDLVNQLLLDSHATALLHDQWTTLWPEQLAGPKEKGIHLAFFITQSGLIRYIDEKLPNIQYAYSEPTTESEPTSDSENVTVASSAAKPTDSPEAVIYKATPYFHFIDRLNEGPMDSFYKRCMAMPDRYVIDLSLNTRLYYRSLTPSAFGGSMNVSLVLTAGKALTMLQASSTGAGGNAPVGVAGVEMLYDNLAQLIHRITAGKCVPGHDEVKCYVLDEHGFLIYASHNISYENAFRYTKSFPLGKFFGDLGFVERRLFQLFADTDIGVYERVVYVDYQAMCTNASYESKRASRLPNPIYNLALIVQWLWAKLTLIFFGESTLLTLITGTFRSVNGYTSSFQTESEALPCDKAASYFLLHNGSVRREWDQLRVMDVCGRDSKKKCTIEAKAALVRNTNLLFVQTKTLGRDCAPGSVAACRTTYKLLEATSEADHATPLPSTGFQMVNNASDKVVGLYNREQMCKSIKTRERRTGASQCLNSTGKEDTMRCSLAACSVQLWLASAVIAVLVAVS